MIKEAAVVFYHSLFAYLYGHGPLAWHCRDFISHGLFLHGLLHVFIFHVYCYTAYFLHGLLFMVYLSRLIFHGLLSRFIFHCLVYGFFPFFMVLVLFSLAGFSHWVYCVGF